MMSDKLNEQISALVDGELSQAEEALFIRRLAEDRDLQDALARYQLISDAMHEILPRQVDTGFSQRVRKALDAEPVVERRAGLLVGTGPLLKPLAGLAVAASIALVAVFSLQTLRQEQMPVPVMATAPADSDYIRATDGQQPAVSQLVRKAQNSRRLDAYLVNHNEYAISRSMRGMLPYVRIVGHELGEEDKE